MILLPMRQLLQLKKILLILLLTLRLLKQLPWRKTAPKRRRLLPRAFVPFSEEQTDTMFLLRATIPRQAKTIST